MYGIVNKAIEDLIVHNYGEAKWETIKDLAGIDIDYFLSHEPYDDDITYKIAGAASTILGKTVDEILFVFGEWWVLRTGTEKYGGLMSAGGKNLAEFLVNLPMFHNRIMLLYPKLTPPEFRVSDETDNSIRVHYFSKRPGLKAFVHGLLNGLATFFKTNATITLLDSRDNGSDHEIFEVSW